MDVFTIVLLSTTLVLATSVTLLTIRYRRSLQVEQVKYADLLLRQLKLIGKYAFLEQVNLELLEHSHEQARLIEKFQTSNEESSTALRVALTLTEQHLEKIADLEQAATTLQQEHDDLQAELDTTHTKLAEVQQQVDELTAAQPKKLTSVPCVECKRTRGHKSDCSQRVTG